MIKTDTIKISNDTSGKPACFQVENKFGEIIYIPFDKNNRDFQEIKAAHEKAKGKKPTNFDFSEYEL
jgi:hypothetical protein